MHKSSFEYLVSDALGHSTRSAVMGAKHRGRTACVVGVSEGAYDCSHGKARKLRVFAAKDGGAEVDCIKICSPALQCWIPVASPFILSSIYHLPCNLLASTCARPAMNNSAILNPAPGSVERVQEQSDQNGLTVVYNAIRRHGRFYHAWKPAKYPFPCDVVCPLG